MTYEEAVAYLDQHAGRGVKPGLERITAILEAMDNPQLTYPVVHVTGTKGKSSVARMVSAIAAAHSLTVGTYTSPHLEGVEERLTYNNEPASPEMFASAVTDAAAFDGFFESDPERRLTYFEFVTAVALGWFAERAVDLAVVEVGLGGRLDATNVVQPQVAVVTNVALEHTEYLGETIEEVAGEKVAIAKPGASFVTGDLSGVALDVAGAHAKEMGTRWLHFGRDYQLDDAVRAIGGWVISVDGIYGTYDDVPLPLHGRHQHVNAAIAIAATEELLGRELSADAVREGLAALTMPGRLEVLGRNPVVVLDGAHTAESMAAGTAALDEEFPPFLWKVVLGSLGDKNLDRMVESLASVAGELFAVTAPSERAVPAEDIARTARGVVEATHVAGSVENGVTMALEAAGPDGAVLVTGSMYVAGAARSLLMKTERS